jgi:hypothetical protein
MTIGRARAHAGQLLAAVGDLGLLLHLVADVGVVGVDTGEDGFELIEHGNSLRFSCQDWGLKGIADCLDVKAEWGKDGKK